MAKVSPIQTKFTGGIFSPLLLGRVDSDRYATGMYDLLNYLVFIQGPITRRPGSIYVAPSYNAGSILPRLKRFQFSTTQAYLIEFAPGKIRFYRNNAAILEAPRAITGITKAHPAFVSDALHPYVVGDEIEIVGVLGMTQVNGRRFRITNVNAAGYEISDLDTTSYGVYISGGTSSRVYTVDTPYTAADLFQLQFTQSADVLYVAHNNYPPRKITRTDHAAWTVSTLNFLDGPYLTANPTATTLQPSATTGAITITASAPVFTLVTDIGRLVRIKHASTWGYAVITAVATTISASATVISAFGAATAQANWRLGLYSLTTGYPAAVTFSGDRLFFGGPTAYPQRFDGSKISDYENFAPTATDSTVTTDNAVGFTTNSSDVQAIKWMADNDKGLVIGTQSGEWLARPSTQGEALSPTNIDAKQFTFYGSAPVEPIKAGESLLFLQKQRRKIREVTFIQEKDKFTSPDITRIAENMTASGVVQMAYAQEPQGMVWAARTDGGLRACTFERDIDGSIIAAWHRHQLGGVLAKVGSVEVVPSADGLRDDVWLAVQRTIGGQRVYYIEYLDKIFDSEDVQTDMHYVDAGATYIGAAATTLSGLWHLEGETVSLLGNGAVFPNVVVTNGQITIPNGVSVTTAHVGYTFNSDGQRLRDEAGSQDGTALGKTRRVNRVSMLLDRTGIIKVGPAFDKLTPWKFRKGNDQMGVATPLFTGIKAEPFDGGYDFDGTVCWRQDSPVAGTILAVAPQMKEEDRA